MSIFLVAPAVLVLGGVVLNLLPTRPLGRSWWKWLALGSVGVAGLPVLASGYYAPGAGVGAHSLWSPDGLARLLQVLVLAAAACGLLLDKNDTELPGQQGLLLLSVAAALVTAGASDLLGLPVALLAALLPLWTLAAGSGERGREGALKAMVTGLLGVILAGAGAALFLVEVGSIQAGQVAAFLGSGETVQAPLLLGLALWLAGLGMLLGLFPLHMWLVDFFDVLPAAGLVLLGGGVLAAGVGGVARMLLLALGQLAPAGNGSSGWAVLVQVGGLAAVALTGAAVLGQRRLRRLFANLLVGQLGLLLVVVAAAGTMVSNASGLAEQMMTYLAFFLVIHSATWMGLVLAVELLEREHGDSSIEQLPGLVTDHPRLALVVGLALVSLAGMPPTAGFWSRWLLLEGLVAAGWNTSAILLALSLGLQLVVSLGLVTAMFRPAASNPARRVLSPGLQVVAWVVVLVLCLPGLLPLGVLNWCSASVAGLLGG